jgi:hypothetical protein
MELIGLLIAVPSFILGFLLAKRIYQTNSKGE